MSKFLNYYDVQQSEHWEPIVTRVSQENGRPPVRWRNVHDGTEIMIYPEGDESNMPYYIKNIFERNNYVASK